MTKRVSIGNRRVSVPTDKKFRVGLGSSTKNDFVTYNDNSSDYLLQNAETDATCPLRRVSNGDGRAWTITALFQYVSDTGYLFAQSTSTSTSLPAARFRINSDATWDFFYGDDAAQLRFNGGPINVGTIVDNNVNPPIIDGGWNSITVTFDGGTTGNTSGDINDYYSRFKFYKTD